MWTLCDISISCHLSIASTLPWTTTGLGAVSHRLSSGVHDRILWASTPRTPSVLSSETFLPIPFQPAKNVSFTNALLKRIKHDRLDRGGRQDKAFDP